MNPLLLALLGGPIVMSAPFVLAYHLVQKPADEIARAKAEAEAAERAAKLRASAPRRKELVR